MTKLSREKIFFIILLIILLLSIYIIYWNIIDYINIYKAISGVDVKVADIKLSELGESYKIYVKILITNPSDLNINFVDIGGHIKLNTIYLGIINFYDKPQVIGKRSFNVTLMGVYEATPDKITIIKKALMEGKFNWEIYGWATFEVKGQRLMVEYRLET